MTSKGRTGKIETLIESCRSEGKWSKSIELAEELRNSSPNHECLAKFLIAEGKLENYLEQSPPIEANFQKAKLGLIESKMHLHSVVGDEGRKAGIALDSHLLLAKLYYASGDFEQSLEHFKLAELDNLSEKQLSSRSLKILAESYAVKGLCLESKGPKSTSKFKIAEMQSEMISCFERASDLGLLYLQSQENSGENRHMGAILETALQRAPIVLIKSDKLQAAIERYRCMLNAVETKPTQSLRLTLARQLAEVLLRGVSGTIYTPPTSLPRGASTGSGTKRLWMPKKYSSRNQFVPKCQHEETILLLLISEALAVRDTVLSQSPEFREARAHALGNATAVYDLLALATVRWGQVSLLHDSLEKALKFSFGEQHVWRQYAISLISLGRHAHALSALKESTKLSPNDTVQLLMTARLCYESLGLIHEGLHYSTEALRKEVKGVRTRAQLYVGIGLQQISINSNLKSERDIHNKAALEALERANQIDNMDHLAEYYLAYHHAINHNIADALTHIKTALSLRPEHASSLHLFALLLTANRKPNQALEIADNALEEFPDDLNLLHVKAHLELHLKNPEVALNTLQKMLLIWRDLYESQTQVVNGVADHEIERYSDTRSVIQFAPSQISDKDSNSIHAASIAASRIEHALSEAASSLSSFSPKPGPQKAWMIQLRIWLLLAEVYLEIDLPNEAMNCVQEAVQINPMCHQIMYMRGQIHVHQSQWLDAKQCFLNAVSANPYHPEALRALGEAHYILGEPRLAEKILKDAVKMDPNSPNLWFTLGQVMESLGDFTASADCMTTALQLEPNCPLLPFTSVALVFE